MVFYNNLSWYVTKLPEKDISNVEIQFRAVFYNKLPWLLECGWCLNYLKKISQTWRSSIGSILQQAAVVPWCVPGLPEKDYYYYYY